MNFYPVFNDQCAKQAVINETQTRVDDKDFGNWAAAGLPVNEDGHVTLGQDMNRDLWLCDDTMPKALIWILAKIVNYLAIGDSIDGVFPQDSNSPVSLIGINQLTLLSRWQQLVRELDKWSQELPDIFAPCAHLVEDVTYESIFPEIWFSIPMCASTMLLYHMARIILLVNKPQESTARQNTLCSRLQSYRYIDAEARYHSREICGIALGTPDASVRIHMVQPLFVAGQCLTQARERQVILKLLKDVEDDLGWATDSHVQKLQFQWNEGLVNQDA